MRDQFAGLIERILYVDVRGGCMYYMLVAGGS